MFTLKIDPKVYCASLFMDIQYIFCCSWLTVLRMASNKPQIWTPK